MQPHVLNRLPTHFSGTQLSMPPLAYPALLMLAAAACVTRVTPHTLTFLFDTDAL